MIWFMNIIYSWYMMLFGWICSVLTNCFSVSWCPWSFKTRCNLPRSHTWPILKLKRHVEQPVFHSFVVWIGIENMWDSFRISVHVSSLQVIIHNVGVKLCKNDRGLPKHNTGTTDSDRTSCPNMNETKRTIANERLPFLLFSNFSYLVATDTTT